MRSFNMNQILLFSDPDGPPTNLTSFPKTSTSLVVKLCLPAADKVNGIITHYTIFYSVFNTSGTENATVLARCIHEICEICVNTVISGLKMFTDYQLKAAAHTKIGMGPQSNNLTVVKTLEDGKTFFSCHFLYALLTPSPLKAILFLSACKFHRAMCFPVEKFCSPCVILIISHSKHFLK